MNARACLGVPESAAGGFAAGVVRMNRRDAERVIRQIADRFLNSAPNKACVFAYLYIGKLIALPKRLAIDESTARDPELSRTRVLVAPGAPRLRFVIEEVTCAAKVCAALQHRMQLFTH